MPDQDDRRAMTPVKRALPAPLLLAVALAVVVRLVLLGANLLDRSSPLRDAPGPIRARLASSAEPTVHPIGYEYSSVAFSLVDSGEGFASPFGGRTGPTAWTAPGPVALYAASFKLFGSFSLGSVVALFALALAGSAAVTVMVYRIAVRLFGDPRIGGLAAVLFAVAPHEAWLFRSRQIFDLNLFVVLFALLLLLALRLRASQSTRDLVVLAAATGVAGLCNPGFLPGVALMVAVALWRRPLTRVLGSFALFAVIVTLIIGPWVLFQRTRLGAWVLVKSNLPFELWLGNTEAARGLLDADVFSALHPSQSSTEYARYRSLGEIAYVRDKGTAFRTTVSAGAYLRNCWQRASHYFFVYSSKSWDTNPWRTTLKRVTWPFTGVALAAFLVMRRGRLDRDELLLLLHTVAYAAPYVLVAFMDRYAIPVVPAGTVCGAWCVGRLVLRDARQPAANVTP